MKLTTKSRQTINNKLADLCAKRHTALPISDINAALAPHGFKMEEALFCGREGRCNIEVGATNSILAFYWLKGELDGMYEVNAYLS